MDLSHGSCASSIQFRKSIYTLKLDNYSRIWVIRFNHQIRKAITRLFIGKNSPCSVSYQHPR